MRGALQSMSSCCKVSFSKWLDAVLYKLPYHLFVATMRFSPTNADSYYFLVVRLIQTLVSAQDVDGSVQHLSCQSWPCVARAAT